MNARCVCKHSHCADCEKLSVPAQTSDWWICCRCKELNRRNGKPRAIALSKMRCDIQRAG